MKFGIEKIVPSKVAGEKAWTVQGVAVRKSRKETFFLDVSPEVLQSVLAFRKALYDTFGARKKNLISKSLRKNQKEWTLAVKRAFDAGEDEPEDCVNTLGNPPAQEVQDNPVDEHIDGDKLKDFAERRLANARQVLDAIGNLGPMTEEVFSFLVGPADVSLTVDAPSTKTVDMKGGKYADTP